MKSELIEAKLLGSYLGIKNLFLKNEGSLDCGSHKSRAAEAHVSDAIRNGYSGITTATCDELSQINATSEDIANTIHSGKSSFNEKISQFEKAVLEKLLSRCKNITEAAQISGLSRSTFDSKRKKYDL